MSRAAGAPARGEGGGGPEQERAAGVDGSARPVGDAPTAEAPHAVASAAEAQSSGGDEATVAAAEPVRLTALPATRYAPPDPSRASGVEPASVRSGGHAYGGVGLRIERELARGGMGAVYLARDEELGRLVAYKAMLPHLAGDPDLASRFFAEVQVTAQLDHPGIVPIYGLELGDDGALAFSMKLVRGRTLDDVLRVARVEAKGSRRREELARTQRLEIFLKVCDALAYAHDKGVLHRDLKPSNIMVGRYHEVYVMDWGLFRLLGDDDHGPREGAGALLSTVAPAALTATRVGTVMGTPWFMSPEQARGQPLDVRSDVYALGLILFELIALKPAVPIGPEKEAVLQAALGETQPFVHAVAGVRIPRPLRAIVAKATAREREARYDSVRDLAEDVRRFLRDDEITAQRATWGERVGRWVNRHRAATVGLLLALPLLAALSLVLTLWHGQQRLAASGAHERRLDVVVASAAARASLLDRTFLRQQLQLQELARRAQEVLGGPPPAPGAVTLYGSADFDGPEPPPDLQTLAPYARPVSLAVPVVLTAPGVAPAQTAALAGRLASLGRMMGWMAGESSIYRVHVTLEDGIELAYPGMGGYPAGYDPRARGRYRRALASTTPHWGPPYRDHDGRLLLACGVALRAPGGRLLGAATITAEARVVAELLRGEPAGSRGYLVDEEGNVVVSQDGDAGDAPGDAEGNVRLSPLPLPGAHDRIRATPAPVGVSEERGALVGYGRLPSVGWYYAFAVDEQALASSLRGWP